MNDSHLLLLLVLFTYTVNGSDFTNLKENVQSILDAAGAKSQDTPTSRGLKNISQGKNQKDTEDRAQIDDVEKIIKMTATTTRTNINIGRSYFHIDPVFDTLKSRRIWQKPKKKKASSSSSSEIEMQFWMEDWRENRQNMQIEAFNASRPPGDEVNMKRARPSGVPCGDPNQHDMPWGTCMRPAECEEEYRIHRGDLLCGRTQYVCCSIIVTAYDMYQAPDMSFEHDNSLTSDSDVDKRYRDTHDVKYRERLQRKHENNKRKRGKALLKKKIRHSITNIVTHITKLMQKAYRNATSLRIKKAKELMDFVKKIKKQYRKDRDSLIDAHEIDLFKYDVALEESLKKIGGMNEAFLNNQTFRDIVVNGTVNKKELMRLQRTHPVLSLFYKSRRMGRDLEPEKAGKEGLEFGRERTETGNEDPELEQEPSEEEDDSDSKKRAPKHSDYDVEYGVLYY